MRQSLIKVLDSIAIYDARDPTAAPPHIRAGAAQMCADRLEAFKDGDYTGLRIGVPQEYFPTELQTSVVDSLRRVLDRLQAEGATLVPISLPSTQYTLSAYYVISSAEASSNLARYDGIEYGFRVSPPPGADLTKTANVYAKTRSQGFGKEVQRRILLGAYALSADAFENYFLKAQRVRSLIKADFDRVFSLPNALRSASSQASPTIGQGVDVIIHPSAIQTAPPLPDNMAGTTSDSSSLDAYVQDVLTVPASLAGLPALSIPAGHGSDGWPIGVSVIGQWGADEMVLRVGEAIEEWLLRLDDDALLSIFSFLYGQEALGVALTSKRLHALAISRVAAHASCLPSTLIRLHDYLLRGPQPRVQHLEILFISVCDDCHGAEHVVDPLRLLTELLAAAKNLRLLTVVELSGVLKLHSPVGDALVTLPNLGYAPRTVDDPDDSRIWPPLQELHLEDVTHRITSCIQRRINQVDTLKIPSRLAPCHSDELHGPLPAVLRAASPIRLSLALIAESETINALAPTLAALPRLRVLELCMALSRWHIEDDAEAWLVDTLALLRGLRLTSLCIVFPTVSPPFLDDPDSLHIRSEEFRNGARVRIQCERRRMRVARTLPGRLVRAVPTLRLLRVVFQRSAGGRVPWTETHTTIAGDGAGRVVPAAVGHAGCP
ncbi:Glutamyl-tRNA(Gln) amidotransferase subunit A, mitochondrial [Trametes pubescens]|uniref:Glutamyl-tRNA(Gln) amidotransferase subunit A, mitochondrial n=1 Tax=Trametes pubescens TaxID=154538 RepID=A0A1M2V5X7_TRAPU|nr:Glutamyl-tRNA(Gln) amidotransferase subunit A, mitochondrial [Trametes pubescens]